MKIIKKENKKEITNLLNEIRYAIESSARPLIFFDDDPDGLCSFLQFYSLNKEAKGVIYKVAGPLDERFLKKVNEYHPDSIFILDVAVVTQEFLDKVNNVFWIDHHSPLERKNVKYFNMMLYNDNRPVSYWAYKITNQKIWLAMAGCVGDWFIPEDLREEFNNQYPGYLASEIKNPEDALFASKIGKLSRVLSFILKGTTQDAMKCVKVMTRIEHPNEIMEQTTSRGKFIWKKYLKIDKLYQDIKNSISKRSDKILVFIYNDEKMALTSDLSNELLYENPDKFIIIGRDKNDEIKLSLRSAKYPVLPILEKSLKGIEGYGGGHLHACGANIKKKDFEQFLENIKKNLKEYKEYNLKEN